MNNLINKTTTTLSSVILFGIGCVMAGLGLAAISLLAMFALATVGLAFLAAPLIAMTQPRGDTAKEPASETVSV
jgi:hypothetical protein